MFAPVQCAMRYSDRRYRWHLLSRECSHREKMHRERFCPHTCTCKAKCTRTRTTEKTDDLVDNCRRAIPRIIHRELCPRLGPLIAERSHRHTEPAPGPAP